jgi:hypothetical protein
LVLVDIRIQPSVLISSNCTRTFRAWVSIIHEFTKWDSYDRFRDVTITCTSLFHRLIHNADDNRNIAFKSSRIQLTSSFTWFCKIPLPLGTKSWLWITIAIINNERKILAKMSSSSCRYPKMSSSSCRSLYLCWGLGKQCPVDPNRILCIRKLVTTWIERVISTKLD